MTMNMKPTNEDRQALCQELEEYWAQHLPDLPLPERRQFERWICIHKFSAEPLKTAVLAAKRRLVLRDFNDATHHLSFISRAALTYIDEQTRKKLALESPEIVELIEQFRNLWKEVIGDIFECPGDAQFFEWADMCGWDWGILESATNSLWSRSQSAMNPTDRQGHAIKHFSAHLIRETLQKYGRLRPLQEAA